MYIVYTYKSNYIHTYYYIISIINCTHYHLGSAVLGWIEHLHLRYHTYKYHVIHAQRLAKGRPFKTRSCSTLTLTAGKQVLYAMPYTTCYFLSQVIVLSDQIRTNSHIHLYYTYLLIPVDFSVLYTYEHAIDLYVRQINIEYETEYVNQTINNLQLGMELRIHMRRSEVKEYKWQKIQNMKMS